MNFSSISAHSEIKKRLISTVQSGRVSHAQLFGGDSTSYALPMAIAYARYLLCPNRGENDPCEVCPTCYKTRNLEHPDLHFVFPVNKSKLSRSVSSSSGDKPISDHFIHLFREFVIQRKGVFTETEWYEKMGIENQQGNINKEDATELLRKMSFKSFEGGYKVVIVYLPERMHTAAANALLKLVEEPPSGTLFLFVSETPDKVISTITSRTQILSLPPQGRLKLSNEEFFVHFTTLMRQGYLSEFVGLMSWSERIAQLTREEIKAFMEYSISMLREAYIIGTGNIGLSALEGDELDFARKFAPYVNHLTIEPLVKEFELALSQIKSNGSAKIVFTHFALQISKIIINGKRALSSGQ